MLQARGVSSGVIASALTGAALLCFFLGPPPPPPAPCPVLPPQPIVPPPPAPTQRKQRSVVQPFPAQAAERRRLSFCQNEVYVTHQASLWTMLIGDDAGYIRASSKMLESAKRHSTEPFEALVLELKQKPLRLWAKEALRRAGWTVCTADRVPPPDEEKTFKHFRDQYSKFQLWRAVELKTIVYLDADTYVVGNIDPLLRLELGDRKIGASRDYLKVKGGWLKTFNMGVFVIHPSKRDHNELMEYHRGEKELVYDKFWSEQAFLNALWKDNWYDIGFENNANLALWQDNRGFWARREANLRVVHFTVKKPWKNCKEQNGAFLPICDWWTDSRGL
eukprot:TRINITY_DN12993_c0_g1_i1.p1 TRINITY_DN12993_c0_g1~~TRINITY_DN12993_c0_g1_i1.p1  ORF type:complete len:356 (+),score=57.02 TRINITY_DN12993_c0_g1_i1:68-1069(+)